MKEKIGDNGCSFAHFSCPNNCNAGTLSLYYICCAWAVFFSLQPFESLKREKSRGKIILVEEID